MKNSFSFLLRELFTSIPRSNKIQLFFLLIVMGLASVAEVISIGAVLPFLVAISSPSKLFEYQWVQPLFVLFSINSSNAVLFLTILFIGAVVIASFLRIALIWMQTRISFNIGGRLSFDIYRRTLYQPYITHVGRNSSELVSAISTKATGVVSYTLIPLLTILSSLGMLMSVIVALIYINPFIALASLLGYCFLYLVVVLSTKNQVNYDAQVISEKTSYLIKLIQEGLGGIRDILLDGTQKMHCDLYLASDTPLRRSQANLHIVAATPRYLIESVGITSIAIFACFFSGNEAIESSGGMIPVLGAFAIGAQRVFPLLQQIYSNWTMLKGGRGSLEDAVELLSQPLPSYSGNEYLNKIPFARKIALQDLSFRYSERGGWVIRNLNLEIQKGSRVGFIGSTGGGKSTLLDIIMGLLRPTHGHILIDDTAITEENFKGWQARIAHVPQNIFLSDSSILENIAFGIDKACINLEGVKEAAIKANIATVIESWPSGYQTVVGERGVRLSGGQRQRIGIARAIYKRADVIILDEATSALDDATERSVMDEFNLLGPDVTLLIVAHRLSTLKNCNKSI